MRQKIRSSLLLKSYDRNNGKEMKGLEVARDFIQQGIELGFISTGCAGAELNMDSIDEMLDKFEEAIKKAKGELQ
jgi:N-acetylglutamate synthase/N-acetylornithine aminotransferase